MKPVLECCEPKSAWFPSGLWWAHAKDCPVSAGKKVRSAAEQRARELHPAGKNGGW